MFLKGIKFAEAEDYFYKNREEVGGWIFSQTYHVENGCYGCMPDEILNGLIGDYQVFLTKDFMTELKKYPLDYVVWDKTADPSWKIDRFFKKEIYNKDSIVIYSVN